MIFDDHDIRDDWNTSWTWQQEINATPWWHERLVAGLTSYWVHQHIGNLAPEELAEDRIWTLLDGAGPGEVDLTAPFVPSPSASTRSRSRIAGATPASSAGRA